MHSIPIASLSISPNRQRQEFDPESLTDLANSISARGLLHAPVMRETPVGPVLVAGERRIRAMEQIWLFGDGVAYNGIIYPPGSIPYVTLGELDPLEAEEAELDENLRREDLTWQEQSSAIARLHTLRTKQAEAVGQKHTYADTLKELPAIGAKGLAISQVGTISQSVTIARHLDNPEVQKAKSLKEGLKVLQRQEYSRKNIELAERIGRNFNSSSHRLIHADCLEWMKDCPDNSFDVILTDPPYGMNAQEFGDGAGKLVNSEHHYDDSLGSWRSLINTLVPALYRVAKAQAHAYIFCDIDNFHELRSICTVAGWYVFRTPLINYKPNSGRVPLPEHGPRRQYELCLYAIKGDKPVTGIYSDVISTTLEENLFHGAQKPVSLYTDLLKRSIRPGDSVFDPFAGTGTIFPAAHQMKVKATGIEINPEYFGIAVQRLNKLDDEPNMI